MYEFYLTSLCHVKGLSISSVPVETPAASHPDMLAAVLERFEVLLLFR